MSSYENNFFELLSSFEDCWVTTGKHWNRPAHGLSPKKLFPLSEQVHAHARISMKFHALEKLYLFSKVLTDDTKTLAG